jgi:glutamine amidotransferase
VKVVVIDYGIGNVKSMCNALAHLGIDAELTNNKENILMADAVILPGVGAFAQGINNLNEFNLISIIKEYVSTGKLFIGVCLGMQLLLEESEEFGSNNGLGLIKGKVIKLPIAQGNKDKLPHVSWNGISEPKNQRWDKTLLEDTPLNTNMYFVHSYVASPYNESDILATCNYGGVNFCAAVQKDNIYGFQFHPEKSAELGLAILSKIKQI